MTDFTRFEKICTDNLNRAHPEYSSANSLASIYTEYALTERYQVAGLFKRI